MRTLRRLCRRIFHLLSFLILVCFLVGGGICLWQGISMHDQGLMVVSLVLIFCAFLGGLALLEALIPRLSILSSNVSILSSNVLANIFWIILGLPACGLLFLMGAAYMCALLYTLLQAIFKGELFSLPWKELLDQFVLMAVALGLPLSIFAAWIKSRKLGRPMDEVWEELLESFFRYRR